MGELKDSPLRTERAAGIDKTPARIAGMFDAIAPRYDLLNHLLSAGLDTRWRTRAINELRLERGARIIDLCTGTADLAVAALRAQPSASVVGVDFAGEMLRLASHKVRSLGLSSVRLVRGDGTRIPLADATCDAATIGFGIRNVVDPTAALAELARVLRPRGRLAILEFGQPRVPGIRTMYAWYFRYLLPLVGQFISRSRDSAYRYLPESVQEFPDGEALAERLRKHGLTDVSFTPFTLGIATLYVGVKP
jgi:demethylmenaquinone methyltransferase / 2-methoxy-6-polyprenyl-1,4-benzoquinol methylase